jgi:tRNA (Thr-GGU) A37 N-methylase
MTVVRLYKRKHNVLDVTGLDAVNGSPVIDIKPFVREFYPQDNVKTPDWMQRIIEDN